VSDHAQKENFVRRYWIRIVIAFFVIAAVVGTVLVLWPGPYDSMVRVLHSGMSDGEVAILLGKPSKTLTYGSYGENELSLYKKLGTNMLLVIHFNNGTIHDWVILKNRGRPDDMSVCLFPGTYNVKFFLDGRGVTICGITYVEAGNTKNYQYDKVVKQHILK
jgi:hypothetical protein